MPIYEYYCPDNHKIYQFYAKTLAQGRTVPFVSRMVISDALTDAKTTLEYSRIVVKAVPASTFDVSHLE